MPRASPQHTLLTQACFPAPSRFVPALPLPTLTNYPTTFDLF